MNTEKNEVRLSVRMPSHVTQQISEAAELVGTTPHEFIVEAALEKANHVIARETVIGYSKADAALLLSLLDNPRPPTYALRRAMARIQ